MPRHSDQKQRFAFALASVIVARKSVRAVEDALERIDATNDAEMVDSLRRLKELTESVESAYRLAGEAIEDAAESYGLDRDG